MKKSNNGKDLESAVKMLQQIILESDPLLKGSPFSIEANKILTLNGTKHEVDVYVVTNPGTSYESVIFFECKDWKAPVNKNTVMNLKEKVDLLGATRGILVAQALTRGADALLKQYPRIQFRRCSKDLGLILGINVLHTLHEAIWSQATVTARNQNVIFPTALLYSPCRLHSNVFLFENIATETVNELIKKDQQSSYGRYQDESVHWVNAEKTLSFPPGAFFLDGIEIAAVRVAVIFQVTLAKPTSQFRCSIDGDGEVHFFELHNKDFSSGKLEVKIAYSHSTP